MSAACRCEISIHGLEVLRHTDGSLDRVARSSQNKLAADGFLDFAHSWNARLGPSQHSTASTCEAGGRSGRSSLAASPASKFGGSEGCLQLFQGGMSGGITKISNYRDLKQRCPTEKG